MSTSIVNSLARLFLSGSLICTAHLQAGSTVQLASTNYTVSESGGVATLAVGRTGDASTEVAVDYATADGTATNGQDYIGVTNTFTFVPGEKVRLVTVPILTDGIKEPSRNFVATSSNPSDGAVLRSVKTNATVIITDNNPGIGFALVLQAFSP